MHVLIVGAGLGGLTLAQTLRKQGISYEIFERDEDENGRFQGWAIALHTSVVSMGCILSCLGIRGLQAEAAIVSSMNSCLRFHLICQT